MPLRPETAVVTSSRRKQLSSETPCCSHPSGELSSKEALRLGAQIPGQVVTKDARFLDSFDPAFLHTQDVSLEERHQASANHLFDKEGVVYVTSLCKKLVCVCEKAPHGIPHDVLELGPRFGPLELRGDSKASLVDFLPLLIVAPRKHHSHCFTVFDALALDALAELVVGTFLSNAREFDGFDLLASSVNTQEMRSLTVLFIVVVACQVDTIVRGSGGLRSMRS
jgi:hypothetical protein